MSLGAGFPLIPFPCLTNSVEKIWNTVREWVFSRWSFFLSSGRKIWWDLAMLGLCHHTEKSPCFLSVVEILHLQEGPGRVCWVLQQVQAQSRVLAPVKVELMLTSWGQTSYWHVHEQCHQTVLHVSKFGISHRQWAGWLAHKGLPEYLISWEVCLLPLIKWWFILI